MKTNINLIAAVQNTITRRAITSFALVLFIFGAARAQTTGFTFQGKLIDGTTPANGSYDFQFELFDGITDGTQLGPTLTRSAVQITDGVFTVALDFDNQFPGAKRFLEIRVRQIGSAKFSTLTPRQEVNSSPYGIQSLNAENAAIATNATQLGGIAANQFVITTDPRMTDPRDPVPGSGNYIQNTTSPQATSNFNISGTGTAGTFSAATQYNIGGNRVLSVAGTNNVFVGIGAGPVNSTGVENAFFGSDAGQSNTIGSNNAFFGRRAGFSNTGGNNAFFGHSAGRENTGNGNAFFGSGAGRENTTACCNAFFGFQAGLLNSTGFDNSFFGHSAGLSNETGSNNSFFGYEAGFSTATGSDNAFFGRSAGKLNTTGGENAFFGESVGLANSTGSFNSFFGREAGHLNNTGSSNTFFGHNAGDSNGSGSNNTIIGQGADVGANNLTFATAIGSGSVVSANNRVVLGRVNGVDVVIMHGLGPAGSEQLCRNAAHEISSCSSSLRYKTNIGQFSQGISFVNKLRPITFDWKDGGMRDVGFGAEDIAKIDDRFVTYNSKGEVEGVKYDRMSVVFVNALKELQEQIASQQKEIETLKGLVCQINKTAPVCMKQQ
ncbi:MAG: tail fiber domain-containing protein [Pyrinomonadaceae bacterium]